MAAFSEDNVIADDMQIGNSRHNMGMRVCVIERCLASWKSIRGSESGVGRAEMGYRAATFVLFRRVGSGHVVKNDRNVLLRGGDQRKIALSK